MRNALLIVAACLIVAGVSLVYVPAGVVVAGLLVGAFVVSSE
jgi:hypothetical protein